MLMDKNSSLPEQPSFDTFLERACLYDGRTAQKFKIQTDLSETTLESSDLDFKKDLNEELNFCAILLVTDLDQYLHFSVDLPSGGRIAQQFKEYTDLDTLVLFCHPFDRSWHTLNLCALLPSGGKIAQKLKVRTDLDTLVLFCHHFATDLDH